MKLLYIGVNGDYVYSETINGRQQTVRIGAAKDKKDARRQAQAAFDELKAEQAKAK